LSLVCGNATIIKPSEHTPMKGVFEDLLKRVGIPSTWVQMVYGDGEVGKELIDLKPDKVFFTGSVSTGKKIMTQAGQYLIPVELELGGKDPMIIFKDVDLHRATSGALWGALTASGQACTSVEKVLVQEDIYEDFKSLLINKAGKVKVGQGDQSEFEIGPMTTDFQISVVREHVEDALSKGAKLLTGNDWDRKSKLVPPLVIDGVDETMLVYQEETFGPVIPLIKFKDEAQAVFMANDSKYGLTASVWSKNMKLAYRVANALNVGGVSINNVMLTEGNPHLPFGGIKNSGFGRFKGKEGFSSFSNIKSIIANSDTHHVEPHWYPFTEKKYGLFDKMTDGLFGKGPFSFLKFVIFGLKLEGHANKVSK
ncbi:MAG: aldehyde dehydrogenase family protein, partial [Bdellovibrionales bacterium]|nr:aldehyde dehydrogenase family protein [Bdellovibrionales bacterium]